MHEMDSTSAIFEALGSFWWRLAAFFFCVWLGHYVGGNAFSAGEFFRDIWQNGPGVILQQEQLNPVLVPLGWLWTLLSGCSHPAGLLQLLVIAVAFLIVRLSEDRFHLAFAILLLIQPIHTFLVLAHDHDIAGFDLGVGVVILTTWEAGIVGLYWWFWQQME